MTADGGVGLDAKDRNDGLKMKREDISLPSSQTCEMRNYRTCDAAYASGSTKNKNIQMGLCLRICFGNGLCGQMKVIYSERGQQSIHRAEIMLLFGYLCSP